MNFLIGEDMKVSKCCPEELDSMMRKMFSIR